MINKMNGSKGLLASISRLLNVAFTIDYECQVRFCSMVETRE